MAVTFRFPLKGNKSYSAVRHVFWVSWWRTIQY